MEGFCSMEAKLLLGKAGSMALKMLSQGLEFELVEEATVGHRLAICNRCESLTASRQCRECGCEVDFKVTLKTDPIRTGMNFRKMVNKCPKGNW